MGWGGDAVCEPRLAVLFQGGSWLSAAWACLLSGELFPAAPSLVSKPSAQPVAQSSTQPGAQSSAQPCLTSTWIPESAGRLPSLMLKQRKRSDGVLCCCYWPQSFQGLHLKQYPPLSCELLNCFSNIQSFKFTPWRRSASWSTCDRNIWKTLGSDIILKPTLGDPAF